jgi:hypothetical protein
MLLSILYLLITATATAGLLRAAERGSWRILIATVLGALVAGALLWSLAARNVPFAATYFQENALGFAAAAFGPGLMAAIICFPAARFHKFAAASRGTRLVVWGVATVLWVVLAPVTLFGAACSLDAHCDP